MSLDSQWRIVSHVGLKTLGFFSGPELADHFKRHGAGVGAPDALTYQALADQFLGTPCSTGCAERTRANGDKVRYNHITNEFGILRGDGVIRTYFKPNPATHGFPTNLDYFNNQS